MKALITTPRGKVFDTFFPPENIEYINSMGEIIWNQTDQHMSKAEILEKIPGCDVYVTTWGSHRLDADLLDAAPGLRLLTHLCGTVVPVVSDAVWERGVRVLTGNGYFAESVAEGTLAYILSTLRDIPFYNRRTKENRIWHTDDDDNQGLAGKRIGIVSYGAVARHLVRILSVFRVEMYVYDIHALPEEDCRRYGLHQASLEEIFSSCDIITLHTPLLDATRHLIGEDLLRLIRPGALFVNTSRGAVVDQRALEKQLAERRFRAVLDVYEEEPPQPDCILYDLDNVIMIPHMAGPTVDLRQVIARELMEESAAFIHDGIEPKNEVTRAVAEYMTRGSS
ncbi:MAG: hydroxyacid dehydrogenase [Clostridia bacterium]|nr:hydroxyacid dehydrogenase [Clostridia bacterium]